MQFAAPGIGGLRQRMVALRNSVSNAGPYAFVRLSHHGAANGTDNAFLDAVHETSRFGISRSEEHTSELQSLMRISYAVFCLKKKNTTQKNNIKAQHTLN